MNKHIDTEHNWCGWQNLDKRLNLRRLMPFGSLCWFLPAFSPPMACQTCPSAVKTFHSNRMRFDWYVLSSPSKPSINCVKNSANWNKTKKVKANRSRLTTELVNRHLPNSQILLLSVNGVHTMVSWNSLPKCRWVKTADNNRSKTVHLHWWILATEPIRGIPFLFGHCRSKAPNRWSTPVGCNVPGLLRASSPRRCPLRKTEWDRIKMQNRATTQ